MALIDARVWHANPAVVWAVIMLAVASAFVIEWLTAGQNARANLSAKRK